MKRLLLLLLLLCGSAHAQSITVTRGEWSRTIPNADFKTLERTIEVDCQPGDKVHLVGEFVGGPLDMLDLTKIAGGELTGPLDKDGKPGAGRLIFHAYIDRIGPQDKPIKPAGSPLILPDNGVIRIAGLYLECTPEDIHEDGAIAGWSNQSGDALFISGKATVILEDLEVKAHDWGLVYDWMLRSNRTVIMSRVNGVGARSFVNLLHAGSTYTLVMNDCNIGIDGNLSQSYGDSSGADPVTGGVMTGILLRAGTGVATNCTFWVKGFKPPAGYPAKWIPTRIASVVTDQYYSQGARNTQLTAKYCKVLFIEPNGATVISDGDMRWGKPVVWDNQPAIDAAEAKRTEAIAKATKAGDKLVAEAKGGSGENGEFKVWKP